MVTENFMMLFSQNNGIIDYLDLEGAHKYHWIQLGIISDFNCCHICKCHYCHYTAHQHADSTLLALPSFTSILLSGFCMYFCRSKPCQDSLEHFVHWNWTVLPDCRSPVSFFKCISLYPSNHSAITISKYGLCEPYFQAASPFGPLQHATIICI